MRLIGLAVALVVSISLAPFAAWGQQAGSVPRVGLLTDGADPQRIRSFREGLRQLGYVEGHSIIIGVWSAEGKSERLPDLATDLVRRKATIIVATGSETIRAAQHATTTIPIVMALAGDPVGSGFVTSLARPGGNITGLSILAEGIYAKRLQLVREAVPGVKRVAVLWRRANPSHQLILKELEDAALALGMLLHLVEASDPAELTAAFSGIAKARVGAVLVLGDNMFEDQRRRIVDLVWRTRLPAMYFAKSLVELGGLMSYGPDQNDLFRRAAYFVDKILKGEKPGDLPIQQPTKFELVINLKTAKALGLTIPQTLLQRADQVIQ
jgi:putative ABC transport system substrate-binding protein